MELLEKWNDEQPIIPSFQHSIIPSFLKLRITNNMLTKAMERK